MDHTRATPEEIEAHQRAADLFFRRYRHPEALRKLGNERYSPELRAAAAEAKTARTWGDMARTTAARYEAFHRATNSPLLDERSRRLLRRTPMPLGIRQQNAAQLEKNERAAKRFFERVDGKDLSNEITGHVRWARRRRESAARIVWRRLLASPLDPLTDEEARAVGIKTPKARREAALRRAKLARALRTEVTPSGVSLERAMQIAIAATDAEKGG